jgi:hypothetical protein
MKRLFNNGYSEDIINEMDENEMVAIVGDPTALQEFDKMLIDNAMNKWVTDTYNATGVYPMEEEILVAREKIVQDLKEMGDTRFPQFKKELIKDMQWMTEFEITQEGFDSKFRSDALISIKNDPTTTKSKAKVEDELISLQGLNPRSYDKSKEELQQEQAMQQANMANQEQPAPVI